MVPKSVVGTQCISVRILAQKCISNYDETMRPIHILLSTYQVSCDMKKTKELFTGNTAKDTCE